MRVLLRHVQVLNHRGALSHRVQQRVIDVVRIAVHQTDPHPAIGDARVERTQ